MKAFVVAALFLAVCGVAMSGDDMAANKALMKACRMEQKATEQEFDDIHSGKIELENVSQAAKCSMKCFMEKTGTMDPATGEFLADRLKAKHPDKANFSDAVDKCKGQKGANPCETAFMITGCMLKNRAEIGA